MGRLQVSILGFGKIGQALAAHLIRSGMDVCAIDRDISIARDFNEGAFSSLEPGVGEILQRAFTDGRLQVSADAADAAGSLAVIVSIPLMVDAQRLPASRPFVDAIVSLSAILRDKKILVIETSVPVGFCRNTIVPALALAGREHGRDYLLAHSPERIKSGTMLRQMESVPKIIGGLDNIATDAARDLYAAVFAKDQLRVVPDIESAELVKMAGMMYRDLNIALANQLAMYAGKMGIDLLALTPLINSDNEANLLQPGIGVGGHCTPVYPYFMMESFRQAGLDFTLAAEARKINEQMADYAVSLANGGEDNKKVLVLGLAFRPGVKEDAFSPAFQLVKALEGKGFQPFVHDPMYTPAELTEKGLHPVSDLYNSEAGMVFLVTMHQEYGTLDLQRLADGGVRQLIDGRNCINREKAEAAGINYTGIGH